LNRKFNVSTVNKVWTTDITYVWTNQGWLYLAIVVDLYSRQIIGWSVQDNMRSQLCLDALAMAWHCRLPAHGIIHHSDRGSQYASEEYRNQLKSYGMIQSMSRKGNCWDNSPTERVFRTLKSEWLHRFNFQTKDDARQAIWDYITYYNSERRHSALNYQTPMEFERVHQLKKAS
ncbi:IS3 family transposase, partial [Endozoicomonas sp. SM1973]